jgi:hypothetical protein
MPVVTVEQEDVRLPEEVSAEHLALADRIAGLRQLVALSRKPLLSGRLARGLLLALIMLGPIALAVISLQLLPDGPADNVLTPTSLNPTEPGVRVEVNFREMDARQGEVRGQLSFVPTEGLADLGILKHPVRILVNDLQGNGIVDSAAGTAMRGIPITLPLRGSRSTQYPFDDYDARLVVLAVTTSETDPIQLPVTLDIRVAFDDFEATAEREAERPGATAAVIDIDRPPGVMLWAILFMIMCWSLSLACAFVAWNALVRSDAIPFWSWGLTAAILFALPGIRNSLPGNPPYGSVVDWGAFYWAEVVLAATLVLFMLTWITYLRRGKNVS